MRRANAETITKDLEHNILNRWGAPEFLVSDNALKYVNRAFQGLTGIYGIQHSFAPVDDPQADPVERINRVPKTMISAYVAQDHR